MPSGPKRYWATAALGGTLALVSCAIGPPTGPSVVAVPQQSKDLAVFHQEDAECRTYAGNASGGAPASAGTDQNPQRRYDIAYTQCMYSHGNSILGAQSFGAGYPAYAGVYPSPWWEPGFYPWYPGGIFGSSIVVFGGRAHHFHRHFHEGFPGNFHGGLAAGGMRTVGRH
jgi:hypothetical protein